MKQISLDHETLKLRITFKHPSSHRSFVSLRQRNNVTTTCGAFCVTTAFKNSVDCMIACDPAEPPETLRLRVTHECIHAAESLRDSLVSRNRLPASRFREFLAYTASALAEFHHYWLTHRFRVPPKRRLSVILAQLEEAYRG